MGFFVQKFVAVVLLFGVLFLASIAAEDARIPSAQALVPDGGLFTMMIPVCKLPPYLWMFVGPPVPASLAIVPQTKIYLYGKITPGSWTVGDYTPGSPPCCFPVPWGVMCIGTPFGTAHQLGTS